VRRKGALHLYLFGVMLLIRMEGKIMSTGMIYGFIFFGGVFFVAIVWYLQNYVDLD
jgi:hypothetical protein